MAFSLYDATVANYLQILGAVGGFLEKSLTHFREKGIDPAEIVETRLAPDMLPFRFQIVSVEHHSRGAMEAGKNGVFATSSGKPDLDYAALQALVTEARNELSVLTPEAVNALVGRDVTFKLGERALPFTAERLPDVVLAAELLFPCDHGLRHSPPQGRAAWKTRFHGQDEIEGVREQPLATPSPSNCSSRTRARPARCTPACLNEAIAFIGSLPAGSHTASFGSAWGLQPASPAVCFATQAL